MKPIQDLPVGYYLDNFLILLRFVQATYSDILTPKEREFLIGFPSLPLDAQRLYVRLISRKGPSFRSDKISYEEITDVNGAARTLAIHGYLALDEAASAEDELSLLGKDDLVRIFGRALPEIRRMKKAVAVSHIAARLDPLLIRQGTRELFHVYTPLKAEEIRTFHLLFFGNFHQDLTEFVLSDLGLIRYEPYVISRVDRLFQTLEQVQTALTLSELEQSLHQAIEDKNAGVLISLIESLPPAGEDSVLTRKRERILNTAGRSFERWGDRDTAMRCYRRSGSTPSRERQARILAAEGDLWNAWEICEAILQDPYDEDEKGFAEMFRQRLARRLGIPLPSAPDIPMPSQSITLVPREGWNIEALALEHFLESGWDGYYTENHFWLGLFGLTFWDIIFMPCRGAFFNPFQRGPWDLFTSDFRKLRKTAVEARLRAVSENQDWPELVLDTYDRKVGTVNHLVHWQKMSRDMLERSLEGINRQHVERIFDRMSRDLGGNRSGFPDLLLFPRSSDASVPKEEGYLLVEVKGPGDQLQKNQRRWMRYFAEFGVPYRIASVKWETQG